MSGAPKRSHEESGHSKYLNEVSSVFPKLSTVVSSDYNPPYEIVQESRMPKLPRTESRDADKRSPFYSVYRRPSSSNDLHVDHYEKRMDLKDSKDGRDLRFDNRDTKMEMRELFGDARRESQNSKSDKDVRSESRGDDSKEIRCDRENVCDPKGDVKMENDGYRAANTHFTWKEPIEHHRGKRYHNAPCGGIKNWHVPRGNSQSPIEVGKEGSTTEERDYVEAHEAVGENKVNLKGDEKLKDKDRKRKYMKHREWGERELIAVVNAKIQVKKNEM